MLAHTFLKKPCTLIEAGTTPLPLSYICLPPPFKEVVTPGISSGHPKKPCTLIEAGTTPLPLSYICLPPPFKEVVTPGISSGHWSKVTFKHLNTCLRQLDVLS
jgi:hypothetical protein